MKKVVFITIATFCLIPVLLFAQVGVKKGKPQPQSQETSACLGCHREYTPGIVEDWLRSRHAKTMPSAALKRPEIERRISAKKVAPAHGNVVVGCFECHSLNPEKHKDNFDHMGFKINVIVSPNDCATCHPTRRRNSPEVRRPML